MGLEYLHPEDETRLQRRRARVAHENLVLVETETRAEKFALKCEELLRLIANTAIYFPPHVKRCVDEAQEELRLWVKSGEDLEMVRDVNAAEEAKDNGND
jgi:hypothetical protein